MVLRFRSIWSGFALLLALCGLQQPARAQFVCQTLYRLPGTAPSDFTGVVQASDGNFYGTYSNGGRPGSLSVFRVTPAGVLTTVTFITGSEIGGNLVAATDGKLYGVSATGGTYGKGLIFRFSTTGSLQTLYSFDGTNATTPEYGLIQASDGLLYGVTAGNTLPATVAPTIFCSTTSGAVTRLTNFSASIFPNDGLVEGPDGWLYGTVDTSTGGNSSGFIYKVAKDGTGFKRLNGFLNTPRPMAGLATGPDGYLYGTLGQSIPTLPSTVTNYGSVFRMSTDGALTNLAFFGKTNGAFPMTRLLLAGDGSFYGVTAQGGISNAGTIFQVTSNGQIATVAPFAGTNGMGSLGPSSGLPPLTQAADRNFYGTTLGIAGGTAYFLVFRTVQLPDLQLAGPSLGRMTLTWNSFTNGIYRVRYKTALDATGWSTLGVNLTATGNMASVTDTIGSQTQRFYQVTLLP